MTTDLPEIPETSCLRRHSDDPAWTEAHIRAHGIACWNAAIEAAALECLNEAHAEFLLRVRSSEKRRTVLTMCEAIRALTKGTTT